MSGDEKKAEAKPYLQLLLEGAGASQALRSAAEAAPVKPNGEPVLGILRRESIFMQVAAKYDGRVSNIVCHAMVEVRHSLLTESFSLVSGDSVRKNSKSGGLAMVAKLFFQCATLGGGTCELLSKIVGEKRKYLGDMFFLETPIEWPHHSPILVAERCLSIAPSGVSVALGRSWGGEFVCPDCHIVTLLAPLTLGSVGSLFLAGRATRPSVRAVGLVKRLGQATDILWREGFTLMRRGRMDF